MAKLLLLSLLGVVLLLFVGQGHAAAHPSSSAVSSDIDKDGDKDSSDSSSWQNSDAAAVWQDDGDSSDSEDLDDEDDAVGSPIDFPVDDLDDEELVLFMNLEDQIFLGEVDEHVAKKLVQDKLALYSQGPRLRRKRNVALVGRAAFAVGRALFRRFARGRTTRSSRTRVTRHYGRPGNYQDAVRDFNRLRPDNVRPFRQGRISGRTGTMGNHRVTVRDGSSGNSRPTLEIRSHEGQMVRKFRYNP